MKRVLFVLALAAAAAAAAKPASADPQVIFCGITPRIPCGICVDDVPPGQPTCVSIRDLDG